MGEQSDTVPASEFERWLTPPEALEALTGMGDYATRSHALIERLSAGLAIAAAETYRLVRSRDDDLSRNHWLIPQSVWEDDAPRYHYSDFWGTGQFKFSKSQFQRTDAKHSYFGVRFDPKGVEGLRRASGLSTKPAARSTAPTIPPANQGGAPRKAWWDDLWVEMIRRIRADGLHPESAAALQRTMLDWLGEQGFYPGEDTLKKAAIKLFKYLQE